MLYARMYKRDKWPPLPSKPTPYSVDSDENPQDSMFESSIQEYAVAEDPSV